MVLSVQPLAPPIVHEGTLGIPETPERLCGPRRAFELRSAISVLTTSLTLAGFPCLHAAPVNLRYIDGCDAMNE